ncbi:HAD family hydrolase [Thalassotalea ponticola]|uniref:sulfotransferase-like domain-containing protein n=1 Tax=Thalassotalea ponticola TaxID=1523392 RepID=UPI0025B514D9|nr:HAD family hydrolase [Thalassotalea ponticola]MDN3652379.1 HAD family hydrolase [Thalassotalea ponticola]
MSKIIAMWSGPRNISTAMMRSFENRGDCQVIDEPFYGYYLQQTGLPHPMAESVIASQPSTWQQVVNQLTGTFNTPICYQKMMTHHMLNEIDLSWCKSIDHCFLIRNPRDVVQSYVKKMTDVNADDIGIVRQHQLYQQLCTITGKHIPIIDSDDVVNNPKGMLEALCRQLDIDFDPAMLCWPKGSRASDGVWASHWYQNVQNSTSFSPFKQHNQPLTEAQQQLVQSSMSLYLDLYQQRLTLNDSVVER